MGNDAERATGVLCPEINKRAPITGLMQEDCIGSKLEFKPTPELWLTYEFHLVARGELLVVVLVPATDNERVIDVEEKVAAAVGVTRVIKTPPETASKLFFVQPWLERVSESCLYQRQAASQRP